MFREKIDCFKCLHFYITRDKFFPKGCEAIGFKSERMPSIVVYEASGTACLRFSREEAPTD